MRALKWVAAAFAGVIVVLGSAFAYTAQAPYDVPPDQPLTGAEFSASVPRRAGERTLVVLVFDGFAPVTVAAANTPHLDRIAREGAHALDMLPVFPTLSMPNHFSLATGCYPERHGVVSNHFMDQERGVYSVRGDADWLLGCEPLHVAAERQGVRAAVFGHVGGISRSRGKLASIAEAHVNPPPSAKLQIDRVIALLERPAGERPGLITAYVTEPDHTSHVHGPTAQPTLQIAEECDAQIGRVLAAIERLGLREQATLVITTDHGMIATDKLISVERLLQLADVDATVLAEGAVAHVHLADRGDKQRAMAALSRHAFVDVIDPEQPPAYARLGRSARVGDFVVSAHAGYWMADSGLWPWYMRWANFVGEGVMPSERFKGMHGYAAEAVPEMRAIFYAWGAEIRAGVRIEEMRTVDVHPTLAHLLSIAPGTPLDGRAHAEIVSRTEAAAAIAAPDLPATPEL